MKTEDFDADRVAEDGTDDKDDSPAGRKKGEDETPF